jgi:hypothetical protein
LSSKRGTEFALLRRHVFSDSSHLFDHVFATAVAPGAPVGHKSRTDRATAARVSPWTVGGHGFKRRRSAACARHRRQHLFHGRISPGEPSGFHDAFAGAVRAALEDLAVATDRIEMEIEVVAM